MVQLWQWTAFVAGLQLSQGIDAFESNELSTRAINSSVCCKSLQVLFGSKVGYPTDATYQSQENGLDGYWSAQAEAVTPTCRFTPTSALDVAGALAIFNAEKCQFAVRSGGHMSWATAANIEDGITIDLSAMNSVNVSADKTITTIGPGARWEDVYLKLDALNLSTSGGRVYDVGVGGLIVGGGMSFFAPRYGFVCDNVETFQVALANGSLVTATSSHNEDLWLALKGGNNNFGIVTSFAMRTFPQGKLWGGQVINPISALNESMEALYWYNIHSGNEEDNYSTVINAYVFIGAENISLIANNYENTAAIAHPSILSNFTALSPTYSDTTRITNLTDLTIELGSGTPNGYRQLFATATFSNNLEMFHAAYDIVQSTFAPYTAVADFQTSFVLQAISKAVLTASAAAGGNSLGLSPADGNLVIMDLTVQWGDASADAGINAAAADVVAAVEAKAKALGVYNEFIYLNYALQSQDPIKGYGAANLAKLRSAAAKYDPEQVFQKQVPGGYKLYR